MKRYLLLLCFVLAVFPLQGQVEKGIYVKSIPSGARVKVVSGKTDFLGNTPLRHSFSFHSEMSVLKLELSACGYYDTIFKISPDDDTLKIILNKKNLDIIPETDSDILTPNELNILTAVLNDFLKDFSSKNIGKEINYADFAVLKQEGQKKSVTLIFEVDPSCLTLPKAVSSDTLMMDLWSDLFSSSLPALNRKRNSYPANTDIYFSVISGKKGLSVRQMPGVDVNNELRSETTVYEGSDKRVTTTTFYYETVSNPTFNSSISQIQKFNEILFHLTAGRDGRSYYPSGTAAISMANNKMSVLFESESGVSSSSMLNRFTNRIK